ncbi:membrane-fusion protein [Gluconobacter frateurii NBRC 103465]|nr:membrane-fusion protein [Gluconobacter frateurii NBRC 103465]
MTWISRLPPSTSKLTENEGRRSNIVLAPEDGILTGVRGYLGEQVAAGTPLVTLLPTDQALQIELYVNSASIGFLKENEPVLLRYDAFPYQKFGLHHGHIAEITHAPVTNGAQQTPRSAQDNDQKNSSPQDIYRIRVQPDQTYVETYGIRHPLEAGMTVSADIATDRRHLWQWMLDPVISVRNTLTTTTIGPR